MIINKSIEPFLELLGLFNELGIDKNVVLIGSWAEIFYDEMLDDFNASIKTSDIDFLYLNLNKPDQKIRLTNILAQYDYLYKEDYMTGKSKYYNNDIEIEFLSKITRSGKQIVPIKNLGINAECLGGLELIEHNYITFKSVRYNITINIPKPTIYCIHKILINDSRSSLKASKDRQSIKRLLPIVLLSSEGKKDFYNI